ncbi:hypothetical protein ES703_107295 [subsurface metagenome]
MTRTILTAARRAEHLTAVNAARAAKVKADIKTELEGLLQYREYTAVVIATVSTIANGAVAPSVVATLTGDTFEAGIAVGDLEVDVGDTALTLDSVTRDTDTQITIGFTGTAAEGTLTIKVKASGLVLTPYLISNAVSIDVPAA